MINIGLFALEALICYITIIILYKKYQLEGLHIYGIIATFTACFMCLKKIDFFGIDMPIGFALTTSLVIAGNIITQKKGPKEIKNYLLIIIITTLISSIFIKLSSMIAISDYNEISNIAYDNLFNSNMRIYFAVMSSLVISICLGSILYHQLRKLQNKIIISNVFTVIIIEILENIIFLAIMYAFEHSLIELIICQMFRYIIKMLIGVIGTIPIYIINKYD